MCEQPPRASRHAKKRCACARYLVSVVAPRTGPLLSVGAPAQTRCRTSKTAFEMPILYSFLGASVGFVLMNKVNGKPHRTSSVNISIVWL